MEAALGRGPWCWEGKVRIVRMGKLRHREQQGLPRTPSTGRKVGSGPSWGECWAPAVWEQGSQIVPGVQRVARTPQGEDGGGGLCHTLQCALLRWAPPWVAVLGAYPPTPVSGPDRKWVLPLAGGPGSSPELQLGLGDSRVKGRPGRGEGPEGREGQRQELFICRVRPRLRPSATPDVGGRAG